MNIPINDQYVQELSKEYKKAYLDYQAGKSNIDSWGSHQPLLIHVVNTIIKGDVFKRRPFKGLN